MARRPFTQNLSGLICGATRATIEHNTGTGNLNLKTE